jgi:hypothetical protein
MLTKRLWGMFPKAHNDNYQITDLLQLSRKEKASRAHCLNVLRRRHAWKTMQKSHENFPTVYAKIEGFLLVKQVRNAILFYNLVKGDRIRAFNDYLEKLPPRSLYFGGAR